MSKFLLVLVLALFALVSCAAVSTSTDAQLATNNVNGNRMLRAQEDTVAPAVNAADEERGMTEVAAKFKTWAAAIQKWVTNSKLVQSATNRIQSLTSSGRVNLAQKLLQQDANVDTLYKFKIKPDELFVALKLDPKLKFVADSPAAWLNNDGLSKFYQYAQHYAKKTATATAKAT